MSNYKFLISGGGTGGHIFPAIAIVEALKKIHPDAEFLFVGAIGRMEMEKIPANGYTIKGIPIAGFQRTFSIDNIWKNILLPFKILQSFLKLYSIIRKFNPDLAIGTGGFASGPTLKMAQWLGIPTVIQEQNALPGYTNRILGTKAKCAFISFENSASYFPYTETMYTGNAIRESFATEIVDKTSACRFFNLNPDKKTVFVTGGSLGARAINEGIEAQIDKILATDIQLIWQTGKSAYPSFQKYDSENCRVVEFISNMQMAYGAADIIVTRAGGALFEMFVIGKAIITLPSPHVAEDHQTSNAKALAEKNAAVLIQDQNSKADLVPTILDLIQNESKMKAMSDAMKLLAKPYAATTIAKKITEILENKNK
jgi:UDP-N-acetylglucosamine--N-acetylmuramyl-(pentapeptide) pyrophosphoryl-undecaprenol N-acetylglucosamine transferase